MRRFVAEYSELKTGYVDCITASTRASLLHHLLAETGQLPRPTPTPESSYDYLARLREADDPILVIVDELDILTDHAIISSLFETRGVWAIFIGIDETQLLATMHPGVRSQLQTARTVRLARFSNNQLVDILWSRIDLVFTRELVHPSAVRSIAERANGDARLAIALLRECVSQFDPYRPGPVTAALVEAVTDDVVETIHERNVNRLTTHPRLLYSLIKAAELFGNGYICENCSPGSGSFTDTPEGSVAETTTHFEDTTRSYNDVDWSAIDRGSYPEELVDRDAWIT